MGPDEFTRIRDEHNDKIDALVVGKWYALVLHECDVSPSDQLNRAPLAEYIGDGVFSDEDDREFLACNYDAFVRQV